ncbi:STAS domain-containing protein [Rubrobacter marinus]|uniref:STAS domain-containing protein n=1 Tax=Rubrobacter marinus TaxID=2653852 RepID=A0A6G8Q135_9ACTN|nr:STAS domain-containing protein [Rubrobacter marinus]QIN80186.1 STAS domain-containing protein [Rubrobacter marinus]
MGEIRQRPIFHDGEVVELSGEFDVRDLESLRARLDEAGERTAVVDLSGVTFLDLQTTRELAVRLQIHAGSLVFRHPSWAVRASVAACGYENWFRFDAEGTGDETAARPLRDRC